MNNSEKRMPAREPETAAERYSREIGEKRRRGKTRSAVLRGALFSAAAAGAILAAVLIYRNWHIFSPEKLAQLINISNSDGSLTKIGGAIDITTGSSARFSGFSDGAAVITTSGVRYATADGKGGYMIDVKLKSPAMSSAGKMLLAYDRNGTKMILADTYGKRGESDSEGRLIHASVNENGRIAALSETDGYKFALTVYDKTMKMIYRWKTLDCYGVFAATDGGGGTAAVLAVTTESAQLSTKLLILDLGQEGIAAETVLGSGLPLGLYPAGDGFLAVCSDRVVAVSNSGEVLGSHVLEMPVKALAHDGGSTLFLLLDSARPGAKSRIIALGAGKDGVEEKGGADFNYEILSFDAQNGRLAVLYDGGLRIYGGDMKTVRVVSHNGTVVRAALLRDGAVVLISPDAVKIA